MQAIDVIRRMLQQAHGIIEYAIDGLTEEQLHRRFPGATIQAAGPIYVHVVTNEDSFINAKLRGGATLYHGEGWADRIGIDTGSSWLTDEWAAALDLRDFGVFREYAQAVYAASDAFLSSLTADDLEIVTTAGPNMVSIGDFLGTIVVTHAMVHGAELSAIKGMLGLKGAPY